MITSREARIIRVAIRFSDLYSWVTLLTELAECLRMCVLRPCIGEALALLLPGFVIVICDVVLGEFGGSQCSEARDMGHARGQAHSVCSVLQYARQ